MAEAYFRNTDNSFVKLVASMVGAAAIYTIPAYSSSVCYARVCSLPANIGSGKGGLSAIIMGASNFGQTDIPLIKLSFSTRGYDGVSALPEKLVYSYCLGVSTNINFITQLNDTQVDLWIKVSSYPYPTYIIPFVTEQVTWRLDSNTTTAPTGIVHTHTMHTFYTSNNPEVVLSSTEPTNAGAKLWVKI